MKILVDENMLHASTLFGSLGKVQKVSGRSISRQILARADALMVRSATRVDSNLLQGSQIKFIGTATSGIDHIDTNWLKKKGIGFSAAPGCNAIAVVEYVLSALLYLAQRDHFTLRDKTIGIVGVGHIGSLLRKRLNTLGVHTLLCDPPLEEAGILENWSSLERLVAEADVLTFHTPLILEGPNKTWHLVDKELLSALPSGRIIINTCRGAVVDNTALLFALKKGKPISVVLDVWESEPELSLPLLSYVDIGTAHIAGYSVEGRVRGTVQIFEAYSEFIKKKASLNIKKLLPLPQIEHVRLRGFIDESILRLLTHLVYDIRFDDLQLRRAAKLTGKFDHLRKQYYNRREWSSLQVESRDDANILRQLGFNSTPISK